MSLIIRNEDIRRLVYKEKTVIEDTERGNWYVTLLEWKTKDSENGNEIDLKWEKKKRTTMRYMDQRYFISYFVEKCTRWRLERQKATKHRRATKFAVEPDVIISNSSTSRPSSNSNNMKASSVTRL